MKIVSRYNGHILYECDAESMLLTLQNAVRARANLSRANLSRANLFGANLSRANLLRANLFGADLSGHSVTCNPLTLGPIGSRGGYTTFWQTEDGLFVQCGCLFGSLAEFRTQVQTTHGNNKHGRDYMAAIVFAETMLKINQINAAPNMEPKQEPTP